MFELGYGSDLDGDGIPEFRTDDNGFLRHYLLRRVPAPVPSSGIAPAPSPTSLEVPGLVRKDRDKYRRLYRKGIRHHVAALGALAGWTADEYLLGIAARPTGA